MTRLRLAILAVVLSFAGLSLAQTAQDCGTDTATDAYSTTDDYSTGQSFTDAISACRAAQQGLRDKMMLSANVACAACAQPYECFGIILCDTAGCDELIVRPADEIPAGSGKYYCTAKYAGNYGIRCTPCNT